jgi:splicing factor 3B subunit 3
MVAAVEKQKLVYVLNRDSQAQLTISSPLEAHKSRTVTFALCGLDVGFDNPAFAAVELGYGDADNDPTGAAAAAATKQLAYYELDLGLNHVTRKWSSPVDNGANMLVPVPGGGDGPGGVLVCCENFLLYRHEGKPELRAVLPRRADLPADRGVLIVAAAAHRRRGHSFFLLQSEYGDLYKVTLVTGEGGAAGAAGGAAAGAPSSGDVQDLVVRYFDSIPVSTSLAVMRTGFLFAAAEGGNHGLYQFVGTGDDDDEAHAESRASTTRRAGGGGEDGGYAPVFLRPRPLRNLALVDELSSLAPLVDMKVGLMAGGAAAVGGSGDGGQDPAAAQAAAADDPASSSSSSTSGVPQLVVAHGQGARAALSLLKPGLAVTELAVSPLPAAPTSVFTARRSPTDAFDSLIAVSFASGATLVFEVAGGEVRETADSGLLGTAATLALQPLDDGSLLQVHSGGLRHVRADGRAIEWRAPGRRSVLRAAANARQAAVALSGGELVYFELDNAGQLLEMGRRDMEGDVSALAIAPVPEGRLRAPFLAAGSYDAAVRLLSLTAGGGGGAGGDGDAAGGGVSLPTVATQMVNGVPESVHLMYSAVGGEDSLFGGGEGGGAGGAGNDGDASAPTGLFLLVGLANGVLSRTEVDGATGRLSETRQRFLGARAPRLAACLVRGRPAVLALGARPWLGYSDAGRFALAPASYEALDHAAGFSSEQCPEGIVAVCRASLRILSVDNAGDAFCAASCRLRYTPRRLALHPSSGTVVVAESEAGSLPLAERPDVLRRLFGGDEAGQQEQQQEQQQRPLLDQAAMVAAGVAPKPADAFSMPLGVPPRGPEFDEDLAALEEQLGHPRAAQPGRWASCVRVVDAATLATRCVVELGGAASGGDASSSEAITSMALVNFSAAGGGAHADTAANGTAPQQQMPLLVVGTAEQLQFQPTACSGGKIRTYRLLGPGGSHGLELLHVTPVEGVPGALLPFRGRLLAGVGATVRMYDLGKKRLLRKCEYRALPRHVVSLQAVGGRVFAADVQESVHVLRHRRSDNALYRLADDTLPRYLTCCLALDFDTVATADKFGNVAVLRLPEEASAAVEEDPTLGRQAGAVAGVGGGGGGADGVGASGAAASASTAAARLGGAAYKLEAVASFHVGDTVTSLQRAALQPGGAEVLLYATLGGAIGALCPLGSRDDADFFASLELHLRQQHPPLCGRDHMAFRSAYFPVRSVADGDLCGQFAAVPAARQREVAAALERTPHEIAMKVEDQRNRVL